MTLVKERTDRPLARFSNWLARAAEIGEEAQEARERIKSMTPEAPDGSGQTGKYHSKLSDYLGRPVYRTANNLIFFHFGNKSNITSEEVIDEARQYFLDNERIDILS